MVADDVVTGRVVKVGKRIDDVYSLDPAVACEFTAGEVINNMYDRLFTSKSEEESQMSPVRCWHMSDDGHRMNIVLRKTIPFHSGRFVTAHDVAYSLIRTVRLEYPPSIPVRLLGWESGDVADAIEVLSEEELVLHFPKPVSSALVRACLSSRGASIIDRLAASSHECEGDMGSSWLSANSAGSGAFELASFREFDHLLLRRHTRYWREQVRIEGVRYIHLTDPQAQLTGLLRGDIDMARDLTNAHLSEIGRDVRFKVVWSPKNTLFYIALNQRVEALRHPLVRRAIRYLIDYEGIEREILSGRFERAESMWPQTRDTRVARLDIEFARRMLAEAGFEDGFVLMLNIIDAPDYIRMGESLMRTFAQARITVRLAIASQARETHLYQNRRHEAILIRWSPDFDDPHAAAMFFGFNPDNSDTSRYRTAAWRSGWVDHERDRKVMKAAQLQKEADRNQAYDALRAELLDYGAFIFLYRQIEQAATDRSVEGFYLGPHDDTPSFAKVFVS